MINCKETYFKIEWVGTHYSLHFKIAMNRTIVVDMPVSKSFPLSEPQWQEASKSRDFSEKITLLFLYFDWSVTAFPILLLIDSLSFAEY